VCGVAEIFLLPYLEIQKHLEHIMIERCLCKLSISAALTLNVGQQDVLGYVLVARNVPYVKRFPGPTHTHTHTGLQYAEVCRLMSAVLLQTDVCCRSVINEVLFIDLIRLFSPDKSVSVCERFHHESKRDQVLHCFL